MSWQIFDSMPQIAGGTVMLADRVPLLRPIVLLGMVMILPESPKRIPTPTTFAFGALNGTLTFIVPPAMTGAAGPPPGDVEICTVSSVSGLSSA